MTETRTHAAVATHDPCAVAFTVDGVACPWEVVFAHARRRGDWQILETEVRQALACEQLASEGQPLNRDEERTVATAFRRARRLHAGEDLEAWLTERGLTVGQWRRCMRGEALRRRHAAELDRVVARYPAADGEVETALGLWGVCTGVFARWAGELATRAAAAHAVAEAEGTSLPRLDDLDALEASYDRFVDRIATPERLRAVVAARYLDWLRLDCDLVVFADADVAAEARLCVREDGWPLADAARAAGAALLHRRLLAEEIDADKRHRFVRARDGDLLGPLAWSGGVALVHVRRKTPPDLGDDEVRAKAAGEVMAAANDREVGNRVGWRHPR